MNDLRERMSKRTDEELIKIVTIDRDGYEQLGIDAAEEEIKSRNINEEKIEAVRLSLINKRKDETKLYESSPSTFARLINFISDTIAFFFILSILSYLFGFFSVLLGVAISELFGLLMMALSFFAYYVIMETYYQKTLGKFLTKTHVRMINGSKPTMNDILKRTFCRLIPLDAISYLFSINGFHDKFSDTMVVKDEME